MISGNMLITEGKVAIVASRFNEIIVERLIDGAKNTFLKHGLNVDCIDIYSVPGAWEIPLTCKRIARSGKYKGIVTLGCVIKGETPHFDFVAGGCASGLSNISLEQNIPISFGVLTTDTMEQAINRAGGKAGNKGIDAAAALIEMIDLLERI